MKTLCVGTRIDILHPGFAVQGVYQLTKVSDKIEGRRVREDDPTQLYEERWAKFIGYKRLGKTEVSVAEYEEIPGPPPCFSYMAGDIQALLSTGKLLILDDNAPQTTRAIKYGNW